MIRVTMNVQRVQNYFTTAVRILIRNPLYSGINILGLATGLACCILIFLFVKHELSYDGWMPGADRIHRLESTFIIPGRGPLEAAQAPGPAKAALEKDFPNEIEHAVRILERTRTVNLGGRQFNDSLMEVDPEFFKVFALPFVAGNPESAIDDNNSVVLTETMAGKYFGNAPALGKTITITADEPRDYTVTGVIRDIPENSHLDIGLIARFDPARYSDYPWVAERWTSVNMYCYVRFRSMADVERVAAQMTAFTDRNVDFQFPELEHVTPSDVLQFNLQPVPRIHLHSSHRGGFKPGGDATTVYTFGAVAILILVIACINFMNLATARSLQRAREVGIRKVLGANRPQLVTQFLGESVLMTLIGLLLAVLAAQLALPWFNTDLDAGLELTFSDPALSISLAAMVLFVGVVGGLYPAVFLSAFRPVAVLKSSQPGVTSSSIRLRTALVVVQFAISVGLIATTLVIYAQTRYATTMDFGFNRDQMLVLFGVGRDEIQPVQDTLVTELKRLPGVTAIGRATDSIPQENSNNTLVELPDAVSDDLMVVETMHIDADFFPAIDVSPIAGRLFSLDHAADIMPPDPDEIESEIRAGAILNMRAVKRLGYGSADAAIGKTFRMTLGEDKKGEMTVIGVVNDMHFRSIRHEITPMLYTFGNDSSDFTYLHLRLRAGNIAQTLAEIDRVWRELVPDVPIRRTFMDEKFAELYAADRARMRIFAGFSAFAVFVACLGLYGLAAFTAERKTREIGIRKVMGATVAHIVRLLLWQFSRPVLLANVIAWPVAWFFLQSWLENFQYRIDMTPAPYVAAGLISLAIAAGTILVHARRAARAKPVHALHYE